MCRRRDGDASVLCAEKSSEAKLVIEEMCESFWKWLLSNPNGYKDA